MLQLTCSICVLANQLEYTNATVYLKFHFYRFIKFGLILKLKYVENMPGKVWEVN